MRLTTPGPIRTRSAVDASDPTNPTGSPIQGVLKSDTDDWVGIYAALSGAGATGTVQLMVWCERTGQWHEVAGASVVFTAPGAKALVGLPNPGVYVWPKVTAIGGGGTMDVSVAGQRERH